MNTLRHTFPFALVSLVALAGCVNQPDADSRDQEEHSSAAAEPAQLDAAVRVEQAERALDVGRDVAGARAALSEIVAAKETPAEVRDRAAMSLSRACEMLKDTECAVRTIEDLLTAHGTDDRPWQAHEAAEQRLRLLLTGKDDSGAHRERRAKTSTFARVLAGGYDTKKQPVEISVLLLGNDTRHGDDLGLFNVGDAMREAAQEACPACDAPIHARMQMMQSGSWTSIPSLKPRMASSIVGFYTHLGDPIPARYDSLLPVPMSEVMSFLKKGEGMIVAKERPGAPPVILIAAPRETQLPEVELSLAQMDSLPTTAVAVKVSQSLSNDEIKGVMRTAALPGIRKCYEDMLKRTPGVAGKLTVAFAAQPQGEVSDIEVTGSDGLDDTQLKECAAGVLKTVRFPAAGVKTTVRYPYSFTPGN